MDDITKAEQRRRLVMAVEMVYRYWDEECVLVFEAFPVVSCWKCEVETGICQNVPCGGRDQAQGRDRTAVFLVTRRQQNGRTGSTPG